MSARPEPAFAAPWHAQVFALTVHLHERGHFTWPAWAERFSATLKRHGASSELDGGDDYFHAWVETLEEILAEAGDAAPSDVAEVTQAWRTAYLSTPHGDPVSLT